MKIEAKERLIDIKLDEKSHYLIVERIRIKGEMDEKLSLVLGKFECDGPAYWFKEKKRIFSAKPKEFFEILNKIIKETEQKLSA